MSGPHVSVVVSTYNRAARLRPALTSLLNQATPAAFDYEIIVVDNNSSDSTRGVIESIAAENPGRVRYFFEPRQGVSYGRNAGIRASRAGIVAFTDDDNIVDPWWVATVKDVLDAHPEADAVGGKVLPQWPAPVPRWLDRHHWSPLAILDYGDRPFLTSAIDPRCLLTANLAVRREIFDRIGEFSPEYPRCQDHELLIRLWRAGGRALYAPELVVATPVDPDRMTRRYHRRWHSSHGFHTAPLRLQEIIDRGGHLLPEPAASARLYGTPGFVWADLIHECERWVSARVRGDASQATRSNHRVRYLFSYIRRHASARLAAGDNLPSNLARFGTFHVARLARAASMTGWRFAAVHLLLAFLVFGSFYDIVSGSEHWPLSPYPMFSTAEQEPTLQGMRLVGVDDATGVEFPLRDLALIAPFDQCRLSTAFRRVCSDPPRRGLARAMLIDCFQRYESRRTAGHHDGPPLRAIRLYDMAWKLDPWARNADGADTSRLVSEVNRDEAE